MRRWRSADHAAASLLALALIALSADCGDPAPSAPAADPVSGTPRTIVSEDDPFVRAHRQRFLEHYRAGRYAEAEREAAAALEFAPALREPYVWMAKLFSEQDRDEAGAAFFAELADRRPDLALPWHYKGFLEYDLDRIDQALRSFEHATEVDPSDAESHLRRGLIFKQRGEFDRALAAVRRAWELDPASEEKASHVADLLRVLGDYDEARRVVTVALERSPDSAHLRYSLGQLLLRDSDLAGAEAELERAVRADPAHQRAHLELSRILGRTNREAESLRERRISDRLLDYQQGKRNLTSQLRSAKDPAGALLMAELELTAGQFAEALRWYTRVKRLGLRTPRVAAGHAEACYRRNQVAEGDTMLAHLPLPREGRGVLAEAAREVVTGDAETAASLLERAASEGPRERQFLRRVADLYEILGLQDRADAMHEQAVRAPQASTEDLFR